MASHFHDTPYTPPDPMFELKAAFDADPSPNKINLGPGAYLDDNGKSWILPSVSAAEKTLVVKPPGHEYLPILGLPTFRSAAARVVFGSESRLLADGRVASIQTISGTGAVHIALQFLCQFHPLRPIYVSDPSWSNHRLMCEHVGLEVRDYPYYDGMQRAVNFTGMIRAMELAEIGSIWILHPCAHNPTGCDLTKEQWRAVGSIIKSRSLVPVLDSAYQGFASGDLDNDAWAIRYLLEDLGLPGLVCQSFSKSMGLYGERVGALHVVVQNTSDPTSIVQNIEAQLGWISRKEISVAARYGSMIASTILHDEELYAQWKTDLKTMSGRITAMRTSVLDRLVTLGTPGSWRHIVDQIGMFSYTGLTLNQVRKLREKHVYLADNGRVSVSGLNTQNLDYFCSCVDEVVRLP